MNNYRLSPWQLSFITHAGLAVLFFVVLKIQVPDSEIYEVPIQVSEAPKEIQNIVPQKEKSKVVLKSVNEPTPSDAPAREVFGASRQSHTDADAGPDGIEAKKGNTLAKTQDKEVLLDSDADTLPTPTEEYLVSDMPSVLSEVRPDYPKEARDKRLEGSVALDVLIDEKGAVRQVSVIEGEEIFRTGAVTAMKKFKFRPAMVDGKPVAVRIRYSLKFQLEY